MVDLLQTVAMPVDVQAGALEFEGTPRVEPPEIQVTLSKSDLRRLPKPHRVIVQVEGLFAGEPKGRPLRKPSVPLTPRLGDVELQLEPDTVTVYATLREQNKVATIKAVPILVAASFDVFSRFRIETRDGTTLVTRAITVRGAPAAVDRLLAGGRIIGRIVLTGDLVAHAGEDLEMEPIFELPPDVELDSPAAPVEFRLVPIDKPSAD